MRLTREQLYEQIWTEPARNVATRYGVSGSFLARICTRLNVPRPPPGYWAQRAVGEEPDRPSLPDARPGDPITWTRDEDLPGACPRPPGTTKAAPRPRSFLRKFEKGSHPLVEGVESTLENARVSEAGYLRPRTGMLFDIFVSRETLPRALNVAGTIFGEFENRGWPVVIAPRDAHYQRPAVDHRAVLPRNAYDNFMERWSPNRPTVVLLDGFMIGLSLYELSETVPVRHAGLGRWVRLDPSPPSHRGARASTAGVHTADMANGKLCLRAFSPYPHGDWQQEWRETKPGDLLASASAIGDTLAAAIPEIRERIAQSKKMVEDRDRRWEAAERERKREEAERRHEEARRESLEDLLAIVNAWDKARRIEAFFAEAEHRIGDLVGDERAAMSERLAQARQMIAGSDVLRHLKEWTPP
jgi:hypothetical protein